MFLKVTFLLQDKKKQNTLSKFDSHLDKDKMVSNWKE